MGPDQGPSGEPPNRSRYELMVMVSLTFPHSYFVFVSHYAIRILFRLFSAIVCCATVCTFSWMSCVAGGGFSKTFDGDILLELFLLFRHLQEMTCQVSSPNALFLTDRKVAMHSCHVRDFRTLGHHIHVRESGGVIFRNHQIPFWTRMRSGHWKTC